MNTETALPENQTQAIRTRKEVTDISSMLLPVEGRLLLLPGVAVAEIVNYVPPELNYEEDIPSWYLGNIYWRNQRLPLVSFEAMTGDKCPLVTNRCRIAVMNNTGINHQLTFFAVLLRSTPKLLRLIPEEIVVNNDRVFEQGEKMHVVVIGEEAIIPDIQFIEQKIIDYLQLA